MVKLDNIHDIESNPVRRLDKILRLAMERQSKTFILINILNNPKRNDLLIKSEINKLSINNQVMRVKQH